jgi:hypothetical protein
MKRQSNILKELINKFSLLPVDKTNKYNFQEKKVKTQNKYIKMKFFKVCKF